MKRIDKAIYKIKRACNLFFNDGIPDHKYRHKDIEPSGTVKRAWEDVGKNMNEVIYGKESEDA